MKTRTRWAFIFVLPLLVSMLGIGTRGVQAMSTKLDLFPISNKTLSGSTSEKPVEVMAVNDQTGTQDNPAKYIAFQTPNVVYKGIHTFRLSSDVQVSAINTLSLLVNFKGPAATTQRWSWHAFSWGDSKWVRLGTNDGVKANTWTMLTFNVSNPARIISSSGEIRIRFISNNASTNAKLDYEAIKITYSGEMPPATGNTYYVSSGSGSDSNPGTLSKPWRTIQKAANTAVAGDVVYIRAGTYNESILFQKFSGEPEKPITFQAYSGEKPVIAPTTWYGLNIKKNWIVIDGLTVRNASNINIIIGGGNFVTVRNCEVSGSGMQGIYIAGQVAGETANGNIISNNSIHDNKWEGVYIKAAVAGVTLTDNLVENNRIYNNGMEAIQNKFGDGGVPPKNTTIRGNIIYGNKGDWGVMDLTGENLLVENNVVYNNVGNTTDPNTIRDTGIVCGKGCSGVIRNNVIANNSSAWLYDASIYLLGSGNVQVYNNTIYKPGNRAIYVTTPAGQVVIKNNIISQAPTQILLYGTEAITRTTVEYNLFSNTTGRLGTNSIVQDPRFVNPADLNFHLQTGSPAIDAGTNTEVSQDLEGNARPQGLRHDIGAYEYLQ